MNSHPDLLTTYVGIACICRWTDPTDSSASIIATFVVFTTFQHTVGCAVVGGYHTGVPLIGFMPAAGLTVFATAHVIDFVTGAIFE